jgi:hypothetical protein
MGFILAFDLSNLADLNDEKRQRQVDGPLDFTTLKKRLDTVDGSLNLHLGKLEECAYITSKKAFVTLRPKTY